MATSLNNTGHDMKIIVIGATGILGQAVVTHLHALGHDVITASRSSGMEQVDIRDDASVRALFVRTGKVDAIVSTAGVVSFEPLRSMTSTQFMLGLQDKFLGQVRLALIGQDFVHEGGSITLTTGITGHEPIAAGSNATAVNVGIEGFVQAAALELPNRIRINAVSPNVLTEALPDFAPYFPGFGSVSGAEAARAYQRSIEGIQTGRVFKVGY